MSNAVSTTWPSGSTNAGWPQEPTGMLMPGRIQGWPAGTQRAANPATTLLSQAVAWWDVEQYREGDRFLRNRGTGGELLDLRLGSANVANSNDPLYLPVEDQGYVYLSGVSGNFLSVPDETALDVTGDIDIRVRVAMDDWTPSAAQILMCKRQTDFSWQVLLATSGLLQLTWTADNVTVNTADSTAAPSVADGAALWVRVTLDVDNGATGRTVTFYTSPDGVSWSQLGNTVTQAGVTSVYSGGSRVEVGSRGGSTAPASGRFYRAQVLNGIDGTTVLDIDCDAITSGSATSFTAVTNQTVTINRSTSGRKSVAVPSRHKGGRPVMLLGSDDFLEIPAENGWQHGLLNFDQGQSFTAISVQRLWASQTTGDGILRKGGTTGGRMGISIGASDGTMTFGYGDSTNSAAIVGVGTYTLGAAFLAGQVADRGSKTHSAYVSGALSSTVSAATVGSTYNTTSLRVGNIPTTTNYMAMEWMAGAIFRRALSPAEITTLSNYFTRRIA